MREARTRAVPSSITCCRRKESRVRHVVRERLQHRRAVPMIDKTPIASHVTMCAGSDVPPQPLKILLSVSAPPTMRYAVSLKASREIRLDPAPLIEPCV